MTMTTTQIGTSTLYTGTGHQINKEIARILDSDLTLIVNWMPQYLWGDQTYGLLIDLVSRTASLVMPNTLKQWRLDGVIQ